MEEQTIADGGDGDRVDGHRGLTVDVDCMARDGKVAVVGGTVREDHRGGGSPSGDAGPTPPPRRRAYVRVVDGGDGGGDYISGVLLLDLEDPDDGGVAAAAGGGRCRAPAVADAFAAAEEEGGGSDADVVVGSLVSVCSKRDGDWDRCLLKKARIEEAIDRVDRAIE